MIHARRQYQGFTLLELMVVVALLAVVVGMASLSLRDSAASRLDEESARLAALLEGARARSRAMGVEVDWQPLVDRPGFRFIGLPDTVHMPDRWLDEGTHAEVVGAPSLVLGPEPVIGAQQVVLSLGERRVVLATDGLGAFAPTTTASGTPNP